MVKNRRQGPERHKLLPICIAAMVVALGGAPTQGDNARCRIFVEKKCCDVAGWGTLKNCEALPCLADIQQDGSFTGLGWSNQGYDPRFLDLAIEGTTFCKWYEPLYCDEGVCIYSELLYEYECNDYYTPGYDPDCGQP